MGTLSQNATIFYLINKKGCSVLSWHFVAKFPSEKKIEPGPQALSKVLCVVSWVFKSTWYSMRTRYFRFSVFSSKFDGLGLRELKFYPTQNTGSDEIDGNAPGGEKEGSHFKVKAICLSSK